MNNTKLLLIYTGGTIGMVKDTNGSLVPYNISEIFKHVPEISRLNVQIDTISMKPLIDSSNTKPEFWLDILKILKQNYYIYDGFVVLHGTDTMAYTASAISFLIENNQKPIIFTGSQLPISELRTDGRENLITSLTIAAAKLSNGMPVVPEVCIYFENKLTRANRTTKYSTNLFNAFISPNYPNLANAGIEITYNFPYINYLSTEQTTFNDKLETNVTIIKLYPGISEEIFNYLLAVNNLKGIVLETYGSGNAPTDKWFLKGIAKAIEKEICILNVTQCLIGGIKMGTYETSSKMLELGVIDGKDMTTEAAVTKLMYLLRKNYTYQETLYFLQSSLRGEITKD